MTTTLLGFPHNATGCGVGAYPAFCVDVSRLGVGKFDSELKLL